MSLSIVQFELKRLLYHHIPFWVFFVCVCVCVLGVGWTALQARYLTAEDEEPDNTQDNCADAVFPIETHFLMQEVLADGMAFCSLM